jgi:hypothetical protein
MLYFLLDVPQHKVRRLKELIRSDFKHLERLSGDNESNI